jgi:lipopolysaccharide transport system ATP-binding protein
MSEPIIEVEGLGKKYLIRHEQELGLHPQALRDVLMSGLRGFGRRLLHPLRPATRTTREDFWALRDMSFAVRQGEALGVIGRNGAGKSTLLKVLSRITEPTAGRVTLRGRMASLLEVGTGFHPELTGRENIYLNGSILGMSRAEIRRKFDEIVAFAEVEQFLDTPVKRYSSGMYVRLAFAVAAHLEHEVLIVDEVLAVGDAAFQQKCLGKMNEAAGAGRTVLFVSHNMGAVANLCSRGLVLEHGRLKADLPVHEAIALYNRGMESTVFVGEDRPGTPHIRRIEIDPEALREGDLAVTVEFDSPFPIDPVVGVVVANRLGAPIFGSNRLLHDAGYRGAWVRRGKAALVVRDLPLYSGTYKLSVWLADSHHSTYDAKREALLFEFVTPHSLRGDLSTDYIGSLRVTGRWTLISEDERNGQPLAPHG